MSSITFPNQPAVHSASSQHEDMYYSSNGFDSSSSFQMNPLSSHPPRTPKTSIVSSSSTTYQASTYGGNDEKSDHVEVDEDDLDEEEERVKAAEKRVLKEDVWKEMILTSNGRDKAFKLIQYSIKVYLLFHGSIARNRVLRRPKGIQLDLVKRLSDTASGLSFTRKCLLLFNWLHPLSAIRAQQATPFASESSSKSSPKPQTLLHAALYAPPPVLLELLNAVADDLSTLSLLGLFGKKFGDRAGKFSDWCWFLSTLVGLVENGVERQMITSLQAEVEGRMYNESMANGASAKSKPKVSKIDEKELSRLQRQDYWLQVTRAKLAMDLIFVSYDIFDLKRGRNSVKAFAGLTSAILSSAKLYDKHKNTLIKSILSS
ncbi:hypothetical protein CC1G_01265 [Coprinopsis cinerea okayama7|uniref:Peroxisomal biogenesis factor 11 n=1 Tax=Coprinopsis cinerea (strain Okayama-7 / 130 / ATCC MYA-4618 / FGSC 9003) TaxID=240176 RepID=A8NY63_COPC7|nr:hypothetical protein CC1G_01265 [Coprinopsis cinerea okayama7\|eukprot:XP_001837353.2 hypothetical protein CC1G_01265 [Coprinopsis cinerea okayama7\